MAVGFDPRWLQSGDVDRLLRELNEGTERNQEGGITFKADDHADLFFLLADCVASKSGLTKRDLSAISYRSFLELRRAGIVNKRQMIGEMARRANELLSMPKVPHTMWSKMRLTQMSFYSGARFQIDDVKIRTVGHLPRWLRLGEYFISGIGRINPNRLPSYGYIIATTDARNENEAAKKIFDALDLFFAISNTRTRSIELWIQRRPTAKFWLGPHQFFFEKRKFLGKDRLWSNSDFDENEWNLFPSDAKRFAEAAPLVRRAIGQLEQHPLRRPLEGCLKLISEGMISRDLAFRLMRFWSAAERLYSIPGHKTSITTIIDRMVFADGEQRWLVKFKLERAYHLRNEYVHHGSSDSDDSSLVQTLREVILGFLYYILSNGDDTSTQEELLMILDLPKDVEALAKRATAIERRKLIDATGRHRE